MTRHHTAARLDSSVARPQRGASAQNSHATKLRGLLPLTYAGLVVVVVGPASLVLHLSPVLASSLALLHGLLLAIATAIGALAVGITLALVPTLVAITTIPSLVTSRATALAVRRLLTTVPTITSTITPPIVVVGRVAPLRPVTRLLIAAAWVTTRAARAKAAPTGAFVGHPGAAWALVDEHQDILLCGLHMLARTEDGDDTWFHILMNFDNYTPFTLYALNCFALLTNNLPNHIAGALDLTSHSLDMSLQNVLNVRLLLIN